MRMAVAGLQVPLDLQVEIGLQPMRLDARDSSLSPVLASIPSIANAGVGEGGARKRECKCRFWDDVRCQISHNWLTKHKVAN